MKITTLQTRSYEIGETPSDKFVIEFGLADH